MLRLKIILQSSYLYISLLLLVILLSFVRISFKEESKYTLDAKKFMGTLTSYKIEGDKFSFELKAKEKLKGSYYFKTEEEKNNYENLKLGISLEVEGELSEPASNTIPNAFNYKNYLNNNGIYYVLKAEKIKVSEEKTNIFYQIKNALISHISKYKSKAYLSTFIIGNKDYLDDEVMNNYQTLGVSHIFAISGMHVSLLSGIILKILKKARLSERSSYLLVISFLLLYMFITSFQASILRSVGLFILLFFNRELDLNIEVINILYLDVLILLLINPLLLYNVGFLYSSVVSYSLIKYSPLIKGNYLLCTLKVSAIAFLFSLPITIATNYQFNLLSILNNIIIVPLVSLIIYPLSLLTFLLPFLDNVLYILTNILQTVSTHFFVLNIIIPKVNFLVYVFYYIFLIIFFKSYNKVYLLLNCLLLFGCKYINYLDPAYYVYVLDVSQGDSIVIKKGSECVMIDTGGKVEYKTDEWKKKKSYYYTDNTITFLKSIGVYNVDYLILSHGDQDHGGEAQHLIANFSVKNVLLNKGPKNYLEKQIDEHLVKLKYEGKMDLTFIDTGIIYDNENDNSQVILLNAYNKKFLFMGDASIKTESDILKKYNIGNIDVLKVGHHGSKTSSSKIFIDSINVKYSIISVGKNNRYNHPNKEALENLENTKIYRTDLDGTISIKVKNNLFNIEKCLS